MATYQLQPNRYALVTPAGAYMAATGMVATNASDLLMRVLSHERTPLLSAEDFRYGFDLSDAQVLELLHRLQELALLAAVPAPITAPQGALEVVLPERLARLSSRGRTLLADAQGLSVLSSGFAHETAEELAGMSATLLGLSTRHESLLVKHMGLPAVHWAVVGADGGSRLGCWQLRIGAQLFSLVIEGVPRLNQQAFLDVIWCLAKRYLAQELPDSVAASGLR